MTVEDFDFAGLDKRLPLFLKIRVEGITVAGKPAAGVDLNKVAGIDQVIADFALDYRVDPDRKTLTLDKLEFDVGSPLGSSCRWCSTASAPTSPASRTRR